MGKIYADCAATTQISEAALQVMAECMRQNFGNPSSVHQYGREAAAALKKARVDIAACLEAEPEEIYFTSGGTEADNQALMTAAALGEKTGKKHMVISCMEHHAILHCVPELERRGFAVTLLAVDERGSVSWEALRAACREDTVLVSVMYVNNEVGTIAPVAKIGQFCAENGILFHTDAVAAAGHLPIRVREQKIDMLSLSAHKFHGPRGIGVLYVRKGICPANLLYGGGQERGKRPGTQNVPAIAAMARALSDSVHTMEARADKEELLRERLLQGMKEMEQWWLNGNPESRVPGIINLGFQGVSGEMLMLLLDLDGIAVSTGSACNTESVKPSHVLTAMGLSEERARGCIRISISGDNTMEEMDAISEAIKKAVERIRMRNSD